MMRMMMLSGVVDNEDDYDIDNEEEDDRDDEVF